MVAGCAKAALSVGAPRVAAMVVGKESGKRGKGEKSTWRCTECGWSTAKWVGRCARCQEWGTVAEVESSGAARTVAAHVVAPAAPITSVDVTPADARPTGVFEFDRVLGGGLVSDAVVLLAGEPGIGKSTLSLDAAGRAARSGLRVLYVSGEESAAQVATRARRIGADHENLLLASEGDLGTVLGHIEAASPQLLVVDSVQTLASAQVDGSPGNVAQVREVTAALVQTAKSGGFASILVGHVTKDGTIAGPRVLEHLVDVVLHFEGERGSRLRMIRAVKNRFGPTDEVGCFDLSESGIEGLSDPSGLFLSSRDVVVPGTAVSVTLEGRRPLVVEVQALLARTKAAMPRRTTSGLDSSRVSMILAVLERHAHVPMSDCDCYVSTVGGVRIAEPASDLSVAIAVTGSVVDRPIASGLLALGEVGLAGDVRRVSGVQKRLTEAARLGFTHAIVPHGSIDIADVPQGMHVARVSTVAEAIDAALGLPGGGHRKSESRGARRGVRRDRSGPGGHSEAESVEVRGGPRPLADVPGLTGTHDQTARLDSPEGLASSETPGT
ncbi:Circadian clock protein kinase kaiC [Dermatophilus congolensis]|uniref:DNA repair protein RadA n=2 Tax=Dermatophilus congolensis TaxID=1863 RepID=A0AA46GZE9_9MICO|nr:Circadian clock protein kinase kaiC [Dermatophilus congolensis]